MEPKQALSVDQIDLSDIEFWARPWDEREGAFQVLRKERPFAFFQEPEIPVEWMEQGPGYYSIVKHQHIVEMSRQPELFCSGKGATSVIDMPETFNDFFGSMINMDDPRHARLRKIVSAGFTPRMLRQVEDQVQRAATEIVDRVIDQGECDFVVDVAARLPLKIICDMMGIPESEYDGIFHRSNIILSQGDPEYIPDATDPGQVVTALLNAGQELSQIVQELGAHRRDNPTDDLTSALVNAEVDGEKLTDQELGSFFILLVVAGNETTRNAISHGLVLLTEHEDQKAAWAADFEGLAPTAVEEIVRWASPVIYMRRTVTQDTVYEVFRRTLRGREEVAAMLSQAPHGLHLGGALRVELDGDTAKTVQNYLFINGQTREWNMGWYHRTLVRTGEGWKISDTVVKMHK